MDECNKNLVSKFKNLAAFLSILISATGFFVILGWILDVPILMSLIPGLVPMTPNTASCFILTGLSLFILQKGNLRLSARLIGSFFALIVFMVGSLTLIEYITKQDFGIDRVLFRQAVEAILKPFPGRMSPISALNFALTGLAILLLDKKSKKGCSPAQFVILFEGFVSLLALIGYSYGIASFYSIGFLKPMALHSAISFMLACICVLLSRPDCGIMSVMTSDSEGGIMVRRILFVVVLMPFVLGFLLLSGYKSGLYDVSLGLSLFTVSVILVFSILIWTNAISLHNMDTERRKAEKRVLEERDLSSRLIENSTAPTFVVDRDHTVMIWNRACEELTSINAKDVVGTKNHWKAFYEDARPCLVDVIVDASFDRLSDYYTIYGKSAILPGGWHGEGWFSNLGGRRRYVVFDAAPVYDISGNLIAGIETLQDITERMRAEEALIASEERYRELIQNMPVGLYRNSAGSEGKFIMANPAMARMFGYGALTEFMDSSVSSLYEDPAKRKDFSDLLIANGKVVAHELKLRKKDGSLFWGAVTAKVVKNLKGEIEYFDGMIEDVTERKKIEQMKSDFVSMVSHQLKTPVAQLKGYIFNMLSGITGELNPKQRLYLEEMQEVSSKNYRLISDLLNVSRIERGVISVEIAAVELKNIVDSSLIDYYDTIQKKGLSLVLEGLEKDIYVLADKDKLIECISNVINNAIKFTETGSITVRARTEGEFGIIEVEDSGRGIDSENLAYLFRREQAFGREPRAGEGAGLGLYIAKQFMLLQRGDVSVVSSPGRGTNFIFKIPLAEV